MFRYRKLLRPVLAMVLVVIFTGCKKDSPEPANSSTSAYFYNFLKEWYLWNDKMPEVNVGYLTPSELIEAVKYKAQDRWSYVARQTEYEKLFEQGRYKSYGFYLVADADDVRVGMVYKNSPMARAGVTRASKILTINQNSVGDMLANGTLNKELNKESAIFEIEDTTGTVRSVMVAMEEFTMNTVLHREIIAAGAKTVGYLVFTSFLETSKAELDEAFAYFKAGGVNELILDLRYNGGGRVDIAEHLAGLLAPSHAGKKLYTFTHNTSKAGENKSAYIQAQSNSLELNRLLVIASSRTASASEIIINCLRPYMDVKVIGARTHGKPVGMYGISKNGYMMVPICFQVNNALGYSDYFSGIPADALQPDDVTADFGSRKEDCLAEALFYIENGHFKGTVTRIQQTAVPLPLSGLQNEAGCF